MAEHNQPVRRTLTDELNDMIEDLEMGEEDWIHPKVPCWANPNPAQPDFPDPPHWTTKVARCMKRRFNGNSLKRSNPS